MKKWIERNPISSLLIGAILFEVVMVVWGAILWGSSFIQNYGANWLATLLGVVIGVPIVLWVNNYQEKTTERERKRKILVSLYDELDYCKAELDRMVDQETIRLESGVLSSTLKNEIWNAYSDGGELKWIKDVSLLAQIADSYYSIRSVSNLADRYYDSVQYSTEESPIRSFSVVFANLELAIKYGTDSVKTTMDTIKGLIPDAVK